MLDYCSFFFLLCKISYIYSYNDSSFNVSHAHYLISYFNLGITDFQAQIVTDGSFMVYAFDNAGNQVIVLI